MDGRSKRVDRQRRPRLAKHAPPEGARAMPAASIDNWRLADEVRRLDCQHYERCLDLAIEKNWLGFTCNFCTAYVPEPLEFQKPRAKSGAALLREP